jgi:hypothetical protein
MPAAGEHTLSQLLTPLSMNLWRATFVAMVVITVILSALWRALSKQEADTYNLHSSAFYVYAAFCQTGAQLFYKSILVFVY